MQLVALVTVSAFTASFVASAYVPATSLYSLMPSETATLAYPKKVKSWIEHGNPDSIPPPGLDEYVSYMQRPQASSTIQAGKASMISRYEWLVAVTSAAGEARVTDVSKAFDQNSKGMITTYDWYSAVPTPLQSYFSARLATKSVVDLLQKMRSWPSIAIQDDRYAAILSIQDDLTSMYYRENSPLMAWESAVSSLEPSTTTDLDDFFSGSITTNDWYHSVPTKLQSVYVDYVSLHYAWKSAISVIVHESDISTSSPTILSSDGLTFSPHNSIPFTTLEASTPTVTASISRYVPTDFSSPPGYTNATSVTTVSHTYSTLVPTSREPTYTTKTQEYGLVILAEKAIHVLESFRTTEIDWDDDADDYPYPSISKSSTEEWNECFEKATMYLFIVKNELEYEIASQGDDGVGEEQYYVKRTSYPKSEPQSTKEVYILVEKAIVFLNAANFAWEDGQADDVGGLLIDETIVTLKAFMKIQVKNKSSDVTKRSLVETPNDEEYNFGNHQGNGQDDTEGDCTEYDPDNGQENELDDHPGQDDEDSNQNNELEDSSHDEEYYNHQDDELDNFPYNDENSNLDDESYDFPYDDEDVNLDIELDNFPYDVEHSNEDYDQEDYPEDDYLSDDQTSDQDNYQEDYQVDQQNDYPMYDSQDDYQQEHDSPDYPGQGGYQEGDQKDDISEYDDQDYSEDSYQDGYQNGSSSTYPESEQDDNQEIDERDIQDMMEHYPLESNLAASYEQHKANTKSDYCPHSLHWAPKTDDEYDGTFKSAVSMAISDVSAKYAAAIASLASSELRVLESPYAVSTSDIFQSIQTTESFQNTVPTALQRTSVVDIEESCHELYEFKKQVGVSSEATKETSLFVTGIAVIGVLGVILYL